MPRIELLAAGDRRLVGTDRPGIFIDAARVDRVRVGHLPGQWGEVREPTWFVEVFTKKVEDRDADPPMVYSAEAYQFDYPDKVSAEREAERIRSFVAHGLPGAQAIAAERHRQIDAEGWTPEHDDQHAQGELLLAALAYGVEAAPADNEFVTPDGSRFIGGPAGSMPAWWPWEPGAWKPTEDARGNLVKAGALIAAELDRLARAGAQEAHDG